MDRKRLKRFIFEANAAGYASGDDAAWKKESDGSTTIVHQEGDWKSRDNFFGGEPYGGNQVVFHKGKAEWMMVYWGEVVKGADSREVYRILQETLRHMPEHAPFRGPSEYQIGEWRYENAWEGEIERFKGKT